MLDLKVLYVQLVDFTWQALSIYTQELLFLLIVWVAGWPGLALAHGCCWFPAATGFGFSVELGMLQGVSAIGAFYELLSQSSLNVSRHGERKLVAPVELCPILKTLYKILIKREQSSEDILQTLRDET
ncbi:glycerol-3-phosphate dehydrogenase [NAD(+)] GPDHC1, cytosolic-like [Chenopodium quinoa]|uniref:glycerol-3-phosphate dehydrogenase [NAD(+)] GPDHC1, cytosolic-like n=1 Tax=Chenopodium quinoa TaxID=63459 RepID=UPI000B772D0D|nr:glycerol-3-phosphate dehydrogenase [NAD(+)] GPDHC1, cytosolic-like [Chenopodium quinoa]